MPARNPTHQSESLPYERQIRQWFKDGVCGTTIHQALKDQFGFTGSYSPVRRDAAETPGNSAGSHLHPGFCPGGAAQVDLGKGPVITDAFSGEEIKIWIFVRTLCFSRHLYAEVVKDQKVSTWLACHRLAFEFFNGVPVIAGGIRSNKKTGNL